MSTSEELTAVVAATASDTMKNVSAMIALAAVGNEPHDIAGHHYLIVPPNYSTKDITELVEKAQPTPSRKRGTMVVKDVASLLAYCDDQATANGAASTGYLYADPDKRSITAVFNDHKGAAAGWRDHRAEFKAEFTPEFDNWLRNNKQPKDQSAFAEFIEDNMADLAGSDAQVLLDVATTLQAKTDINFSSAKRLQNGQVQLQYVETINATAGAAGALEIPKEFTLGLRIFKNGEGYKLKARLKYRLNAGGVKFCYELDRPERSVEDAFAGYVAQVRETSGYRVLVGAA
jgi:uncharacterized protein YfdQ (DUF2303 family)